MARKVMDTERTRRATDETHSAETAAEDAAPHRLPKKGDMFHCETCGMAIEVTIDCKCDDPEHVTFACCGNPMNPV